MWLGSLDSFRVRGPVACTRHLGILIESGFCDNSVCVRPLDRSETASNPKERVRFRSHLPREIRLAFRRIPVAGSGRGSAVLGEPGGGRVTRMMECLPIDC